MAANGAVSDADFAEGMRHVDSGAGGAAERTDFAKIHAVWRATCSSPEDIGDVTKWEFYAGGHGARAKWARGDLSQAVPLVEWGNHTGATTMTYFAGIRKYVLAISTASVYPLMDGGPFDTYFLESNSISAWPSKLLHSPD